jgi:hypothetical protein
MNRFILLPILLFPTAAFAQAPTSTRVTNQNGSVVAAVQSTATAGTEAGLVVRVAGSVATTGGGSNASVGAVAAAAPASATQIGGNDGSGNLAVPRVSTSTPAAADPGIGVRDTPGASIVSGQQAVTASAVALPSVATRGVCVKHVEGGSQSVIYVGPTGVTTANGWPIAQGEGVCYQVDSVADLFVIAASTGSSVAYTGVP